MLRGIWERHVSKRARFVLSMGALIAIAGVSVALAATTDDPLIRMPGTQPGHVALESPNRCLNCHGGYNEAVEPGFNWQGSMMAQAARDPLYFAALTVAAQDSVWAIGTPNGTDICLRCHFPAGWLEGRSDPTNASAMTGADFDGVSCDMCHRMYDPFFEDTAAGLGVSSDWTGYWDEEGSLSVPEAEKTLIADRGEAASVLTFNGSPFFDLLGRPPVGYTEATSGQYFVAASSAKRASFADADARHQMLYSRFHKSETMCATCHDVSNPILANLGADPTQLLPTETAFAGSYFHVERTYSEFALSAYGRDDGAAGIGPFAPGTYDTSNPGDVIARCQDCHMRDVSGRGADKNGAVLRPSGSIEHPDSGQPLHDLTGGNVWVSTILASAIPGSPNYDASNDALLNQGASVLTLDLNQGQGIDPVALLAGADRAAQQLALAASIEDVDYNPSSGDLSFRIQNQTGHKLISGFPEGRRMFVNVKAYSGGTLVYEVNPYDAGVGTLKGLTKSQSSPPLGANEAYVDELVYEMHPSSSLTGEAETFHFVLADGRYKDNRIPPMGFDIENAAERLTVPVWHGVEDPGYYTAAEYAGGYDAVLLSLPVSAEVVEISLYYQTTSREYIEFLRDQIDGTATTLPASAYIAQTDPFFDGLRAWGDTIWQLWTHNKDLPGGAPFLMASATTGSPTPTLLAPTLLSADAGQKQVSLSWTAVDGATGYRLYYDQGGKAQLVVETTATSHVDLDLTDGQQYCYKVTSLDGTEESSFSNILCATPIPPGQASVAGVDQVQVGHYVTTGKGKDKVTAFVETDTLAPGEGVVVRARVLANGVPVTGATVDLTVSGPVTTLLTTAPTDEAGVGEALWQTEAPNKRGQGGTPTGQYTVTVTGVTAADHTWDGLGVTAGFTLTTAQ